LTKFSGDEDPRHPETLEKAVRACYQLTFLGHDKLFPFSLPGKKGPPQKDCQNLWNFGGLAEKLLGYDNVYSTAVMLQAIMAVLHEVLGCAVEPDTELGRNLPNIKLGIVEDVDEEEDDEPATANGDGNKTSEASPSASFVLQKSPPHPKSPEIPAIDFHDTDEEGDFDKDEEEADSSRNEEGGASAGE
jgi:hypothetical protein